MRHYFILVFLVTFVLCAATGAASGEQAWKFRSDLSNAGVYDDGGTRPGNDLLWESQVENYYGSMPAVVDGVIFVNSIYEIHALDALTGKMLWTSVYGGGTSSPAVTGGVVYTGSTDRNIYALNASGGDLLWQFTTEKPVYSSPAVAGGVVYAGSADGNVYALDAETGSVIWTFPTGSEVRSSPALAHGTVYITGRNGNLYALNASSGELLWTFASGEELVSASPVVSGETVYLRGTGGLLYALDAGTGSLSWTSPASATDEAGPAVSGGMVYIGDEDGTISALDASDGSPLWNYTAGSPVRSSPSVANGVVYAGSTDGTIFALNASSGDLLWTYATSEKGYTGPVIAGGVLYISGSGGTLYALATLPDEPPACVADLHPVTINGAEITWAWKDPVEIGFSHAKVFLNGVFQEDVPAGTETWTARGLAPSTAYTLGVQSVGARGLVNQTVVTSTATTGSLSILRLDPSGAVEDSPGFLLKVHGTGFSPSSAVTWDGQELVTHFGNATSLSVDIPPELVAHSRRVTVTVTDHATGETSNAVIFPVTDNPATAKAREFRSDPANTGVYDDGGRKPVPSLLWTCRTGAPVTSSPAVVDGTVYIGSNDRNLYALDAATGAVLWKYDTLERNDYVSSSPAVANGVVYIGGMKNKIHAVDAYSGKLLWKYRVPIRTTARSGISSSPTVAGGIVFIGNMDGIVYAFDEMTGELLWNHTLRSTPTYRMETFSSPAVADGVLYVLDNGANLYAIDASSGTLLWSHDAGDDTGSYASPAVSGGIVYAGSGTRGPFHAFDARTGDPLWEFPAGGTPYSSPAVANGTVYVGSNDRNLYALDAVTGALLWNYTAGDRILSSPAVADGIVYVGSDDRNLYALDAATGALLWNYTTGDRILSSPAVADGIVYVGCSDGTVYAIGTLPLEPPVADFSANVTSGKAPLDVLFSDTSTGVVTWRLWNFGDGTTTWANETRTVTHTYAFPGTFSVSLTAGNADGRDTRERPAYIKVSPSGQKPAAWFTASPMSGYRPLEVRFSDRSVGSPTAWSWDFGDGNTSTDKNPVHTYTAAGTFRVTLTASNAGGSSSFSSTVWVREKSPSPTIQPTPTITPFPTVSPRPTIPPQPGAPPVAFFRVSPIMGRAPLTVTFSDLSFNDPSGWYWDFGDGNTSTVKNPVHTFEGPGVYTVSLVVENAYGNSTTSRDVYVR